MDRNDTRRIEGDVDPLDPTLDRTRWTVPWIAAMRSRTPTRAAPRRSGAGRWAPGGRRGRRLPFAGLPVPWSAARSARSAARSPARRLKATTKPAPAPARLAAVLPGRRSGACVAGPPGAVVGGAVGAVGGAGIGNSIEEDLEEGRPDLDPDHRS